MGIIKTESAYKLKMCFILGISGFFLNFIPLSLSYDGLNLSILIGMFGALFITQVWGLKYGLLTALFGSTQTMWFLWGGNGWGILYSVPVFTLWIVWHGYWSDKRRNTKQKRVWHNKYLQEVIIRLIIEAGFWTIFPFLVSLNPPDIAGIAHSVPQSYLITLAVKHTANAYIMLMLSDVLMNLQFIKRLFMIEESETNPKFLITFTLLWTVLFWLIESWLIASNSAHLLDFYQKHQNLQIMETMLVHYPNTSFWLRIIFAVFLSVAGYMIYSLSLKEKKTLKQFHTLFKNSNDILLLCDHNGKIIEINANAKKLFPHVPSATKLEVLLNGEKDSVIGHIQTKCNSLRFCTTFGKTSGVTYDCLINCIDTEKRHWLLIARDITEHIEMEKKLNALNTQMEAGYEELKSSFEELEENNQLLSEQNDLIHNLYASNEEIMNAFPDIIVRIDRNYTIQWTNKAFKEHFGNNLTGVNLKQTHASFDFIIKNEVLEDILPCEHEKTFTHTVNKDLIVQITVLPAKNNDDVILIIRNITQIKLREKYYRDAKKAAENASKLKDEFLANISHELRTPMNGILTALNLINYSSNSLDRETEEYLSIIRQSSSRLLTTINEVLDIKRIENNEIEVKLAPVNTADFIKDFKNQYSVFAKQKNISFETEIGKDFPEYFSSDEDKLIHILSNLVFNAVKFTQKGFVKLKLDSETVDETRRRLTFSVIDSGIGIEKDKQKIIFDKFSQVDNSYTRKYEGTGLGLAISKSLARALNSELKVQSDPGEGSTFYFTLNTISCAPKKSEKTIPDQEILDHLKTTKPTLFLAEDDMINRKLLQKLLEGFFCTVEVFENGQALIDRIHNKLPDLILMDIEMPVMNGLDATKLIKSNEHSRGIPVIALTGHAFKSKQEQFIKSGFDDCLTKPVDKEELLKVLQLYT